MAKEIKYNDLNWPVGTPVAGERLATNGYYTGEHKGTPMQDAKDPGTGGQNTNPHSVESGMVRYGTIMGDATDTTTFPTKKAN